MVQLPLMVGNSPQGQVGSMQGPSRDTKASEGLGGLRNPFTFAPLCLS